MRQLGQKGRFGVSVMKGPYAQEWIAAVLEEIESFKRLGVYEEIPEGSATSPPLPARLILVTKPNIHGGLARKKAKIVICGNFQDVHPDEFSASKTPTYPALRMALSVASHMGWPLECWDVSTAFLYARLFGDRDTDLGGNKIYIRPPRILVETNVVAEVVVWKIKKALYGLRTSPIAWETLWTVVPMRPGEDPSVKTSKEELIRGVVITYVDDVLFTGFQCHINALTKALLAKYAMKQSGILPVEIPRMEKLERIDFPGARIARDGDGTIWCDHSKYILHCLRESVFRGCELRRKAPIGGALKRLRSTISRKRRIFPIFQTPLNGRVFNKGGGCVPNLDSSVPICRFFFGTFPILSRFPDLCGDLRLSFSSFSGAISRDLAILSLRYPILRDTS